MNIPIRERMLDVNGIRTPVIESGPADATEAVVFVHGNPGPKEDWRPMLAAVGDFARAVAWDHPGYGEAGRPKAFDYTIEGYARQLDSTLHTLGIDRVHLVLHDFGGPWGLQWAVEHPDRFESAVLINTGAMIDYRWHTLARIWRTPVLGDVFVATTPGWMLRRVVNRNEPRPLPSEFFDRMLAAQDGGNRRAVLRLYRSVNDPAAVGRRHAEALKPLNRPALVVWGRGDVYLPEVLAGRQREAFPGARIEMLDNSGHWPMVDDPETVTSLVVDFLKGIVTNATQSADQPHPATPASVEQV
jgi:pimeloyl-ACP methyl ester carboxylesterase